MKENGDLLWKRTFSEIYFLGKRGFYWNPETGQISLDPGKKVPQSMQLPSALPTKQAEKVWEYQGAGFGMRFLFALLRPHTRYYAVHAMADLTSQSPIPSFQNRRN